MSYDHEVLVQNGPPNLQINDKVKNKQTNKTKRISQSLLYGYYLWKNLLDDVQSFQNVFSKL